MHIWFAICSMDSFITLKHFSKIERTPPLSRPMTQPRITNSLCRSVTSSGGGVCTVGGWPTFVCQQYQLRTWQMGVALRAHSSTTGCTVEHFTTLLNFSIISLNSVSLAKSTLYNFNFKLNWSYEMNLHFRSFFKDVSIFYNF